MTKDDTTKRAALRLLERGLITQVEASRLAGVSRQLMRFWAKDIDIEKARAAYLAKVWESATRKRR